MSDEKKEEKKQEEKAPPEPWLYKKLGECIKAIRKSFLTDKTVSLFEDLFDTLTDEMYHFQDPETLQWKESQDNTIADRKLRLQRFSLKMSFEGIKSMEIAVAFWEAWTKSRNNKQEKDRQAIDDLALSCIEKLNPNKCKVFYTGISNSDFDLLHLSRLGRITYRNNPLFLERIGLILERAEKYDPYGWKYAETGKRYRATAQAIRVTEELDKKTIAPLKLDIKKEITNYQNKIEDSERLIFEKVMEAKTKTHELEGEILKTKEETEKLVTGAKALADTNLKETENRSFRTSVQVIGIFVAVVAFIGGVVPAAIRLGGASIPIIGTGLAIVLAGFLFLIAVVFGDDSRIKRFRGWLIGSGIALFVWLVISIGASILKRDIVAPPPDAARVDTHYIYQPKIEINISDSVSGTLFTPTPTSPVKGEVK